MFSDSVTKYGCDVVFNHDIISVMVPAKSIFQLLNKNKNSYPQLTNGDLRYKRK